MVKISFNPKCNQQCLNVPFTTEEILRMCIQKCVNDVLVEMQSVAKMHNIQFMVAGKCREKKNSLHPKYLLLSTISFTMNHQRFEIYTMSLPQHTTYLCLCTLHTAHICVCLFFIKTIRLFNGKLFISDKSLLNSVAQQCYRKMSNCCQCLIYCHPIRTYTKRKYLTVRKRQRLGVRERERD